MGRRRAGSAVTVAGRSDDDVAVTAADVPAPARAARLAGYGPSLAVIGPFILLGLRCALWRSHVFLRGDLALIDLSVRNAGRLHQVLGPYDRFGWHHPGPVYFYLVASVARVVGGGLQAQAVGAALLNGLSVGGVVFVVGRLAGRRAAVGAGALLAAAVAVLGPVVMINPWNPYVVVLPVLLVGVLSVGAACGVTTCWAAAALVGTFVVQTDVGTLPVVAAALVLSGASWLIWKPQRTALTKAPAAVVLLVLAVALWVPPLVQQLTGSPGNLGQIVSFMTAGHPRAGLPAAVRALGSAQLNVVGLSSGGAVGLLLPVALGSTGVVWGTRRRSLFAAAAGALCLLSVVVSIAAAAAVVGPVYRYLIEWSVALPLLGAVGVITAAGTDQPAGESSSRAGRPMTAVPWVALAVGVLALVGRMLSLPSFGTYSAPEVAAAWDLVRPALAVRPHERVEVDAVDPAGWAVAAGLCDEIDRTATGFVVPSQWGFQYGSDRVGSAATVVYLRAPAPPPGEPGQLLGRAGPVSVWLAHQAGGPTGVS